MAKSLSNRLGLYSEEEQRDRVQQRKLEAQDLLHELLCQAEMVSSIVEDMRAKIRERIISEDNATGCCLGSEDDYLKSFEAATLQLKEQFQVNHELLQK